MPKVPKSRLIKRRKNVCVSDAGSQANPNEIDDALEQLTIRKTTLELYADDRIQNSQEQHPNLFVSAKYAGATKIESQEKLPTTYLDFTFI